MKNGNEAKSVPERQCMGCNGHFPKSELVRILRTPDGNVVIDRSGKLNGRGAYICNKKECFQKVRKSNRLSRVLNAQISDEIYETLLSEMGNGHGE